MEVQCPYKDLGREHNKSPLSCNDNNLECSRFLKSLPQCHNTILTVKR